MCFRGFLTALKQNLQPYADSQKRVAGIDHFPNRRNQSGNFESVDAMSDYPKASTDVLQSLGITPTVEDGLNPMTERLAATSSPFSP